jgi:hypothetical protein
MARQSLKSGFKYVTLLMRHLYTLIQNILVGALIFQSLELFNHIPEEIEYLWR